MFSAWKSLLMMYFDYSYFRCCEKYEKGQHVNVNKKFKTSNSEFA